MPRKRQDLTGKRFGRWEVLYYAGDRKWHCKCSCDAGTERDVATNSLKRGVSISCGCYKHEKIRKEIDEKMSTDLLGKETENFIVESYAGDNKWNCICKHCGNNIKLSRNTILKGERFSCGCKRVKPIVDLTGQRIGMWDVISYAGNSKWNCVCSCEHKTKSVIETNKLLSGKSTKCKFHKNKNNIIFPDWFIDELADKTIVGNINTHDKVDFICPIHGIYNQAVSEHIRLRDSAKKSGCPECAKAINVIGSKDENEILSFIENKFSGIEIITHTKDILDGKEIDIYLPNYKIGIEYNGSAFHATKNGVFNNLSEYYHRDKFLLAKSKGIHLITVFDIDYIDNKDIVLDIIYNAISKDSFRFYPKDIIEYTNNDYDNGEWIEKYGYVEIGQVFPSSYVFKGHLVYRCGKTIWKLK